MPHGTPYEKIAERYERPARIAREFGQLAAEYPEVARDLLRELTASLPSFSGQATESAGRETQYDRLVRLFRDNGNQAMTKKAIVAETGISENTLHSLIYGEGSQIQSVGRDGRSALYRLVGGEAAEEGAQP